jgi:hypothetical protein
MCVDLLRNILHWFMIFDDSEAVREEEVNIKNCPSLAASKAVS